MKRKIRNCDYVCPSCFNRPNKCTCNYPPFQLIMVDAELQAAVRILNQIGMTTIDCCAGHWGLEGQSMYISFDKHITSAPQGFIKNKNFFRFVYTAKTKKEFVEQQKEALKNLDTWLNQILENYYKTY